MTADTFAIYYGDYISEEQRIFPSKSYFTRKGHEKICNDILKNRNIEKEIEGKILIAKLYILESSPHHPPIMGFIDIFKNVSDDTFYSRVVIDKFYDNNENYANLLISDLESDANTLTTNIKRLGYCTKI